MLILKLNNLYFFYLSVVLYYFLILMECLGLKEEMEIEEVFEIVLSIFVLWRSIFFVIGKKRDELWNEKLYIKVKRIILEVREVVKSKKIKLSFFCDF